MKDVLDVCKSCNGSGVGIIPDSTCNECKGSGQSWRQSPIFIDGDFNDSYASRLMRIEREQRPKNKKYRTK